MVPIRVAAEARREGLKLFKFLDSFKRRQRLKYETMKQKLWAYFDFNVKVKVRRVQQLGNDGVIQWFKKNCLNNTWSHHLSLII